MTCRFAVHFEEHLTELKIAGELALFLPSESVIS